MIIEYGQSQDSLLSKAEVTQAELVEIASKFPIIKIAKVNNKDIDANGTFQTPAGGNHIGNYAFWGCSRLTSLVISAGVTHIGGCAFLNCNGLTNLDIRAGVTHIGDSAFYSCSGLTSVVIPAGVTHIGRYAFSGCSGLTSVDIPAGVTHIGNYAFSGCSGLTSVDIPAGVTHIGNYAFLGCSGLTEILVDTDDVDEFLRIKALLPKEHQDKVSSSSPVINFYAKSAAGKPSEMPPLVDFSIFTINQAFDADAKEELKRLFSDGYPSDWQSKIR